MKQVRAIAPLVFPGEAIVVCGAECAEFESLKWGKPLTRERTRSLSVSARETQHTQRSGKFCNFFARLFMFMYPLLHRSDHLPALENSTTFIGAQRLTVLKGRQVRATIQLSKLSLWLT